jgi:hypothetical protein
LDAISEMNPFGAAAILAAAMTIFWAVGWRVGRKVRGAGGEAPESRLDDAALALLGLLLAFTFSMALNKYDRRREALISDSNAIGDFYTCASLLPAPVRPRLQGVIREYTEVRLDLARGGWSRRLEDTLSRFAQMHDRMTALVGEALQAGTPIAVPLTDTLNGVTSNHAARLAAVRDRLPSSAVLLLFLAGMLVAGLVGRQQAFSKYPSFAGTATFIAIVALTVLVTLDLNHPTKGLIEVSQEPMQRLLSSMAK